MSDFNGKIIREFRANGGRVGGPFDGAKLLLMHHTGAKSGAERVTPMVYLPDGDRLVVFATMGGSPTNPAWYYNLMAHPHVRIEIGTPDGRVESYPVEAAEVTGAERDELYARQTAVMPGFADYARWTRGVRTIPVIALTRAA